MSFTMEAMESPSARQNDQKGDKKVPHAFHLMPSKAPLELHCEWGDCHECFSNMNDFRTHVQSHLWDLFNNVKGTQNEGELFLNIACDWRQCDSDCGRGFDELVRHVYFHAFHSRLKSVGSYIVQVRNAPACKLEDASRNVIPELPEQLVCHWGWCEEIYDDPSLFYEHCNNHIEELPACKHPPGGVQCKWDGCEQSVQNRHRMREHLRSHTQERIVACATCGTLFANNTKLLDHLLRQKDINDGFQCSHCNKAFSTERLLRDHMRNHVNHYKCPLCEMTCPSPANLRTHLNTRHTENRPHVCNLCEKGFKLAGDLRKHMDTHSESTFACNIGECKYMCPTYKQLLLHFKKEHEGGGEKRVYRCHLCQFEYTRGGLLTNHLRKVHNFQWPPGHQRFRYRQNSEGIYQLQTLRYESLELSEQVFTDVNAENGGEEGTSKTPGKEKKKGFRAFRVAELKTSRDDDDRAADDDDRPADYSYNLEMLGDVALRQGSGRRKKARPGPTVPVPAGTGNGLKGKKSGAALLNARRKLCMDLDNNDAASSTHVGRRVRRRQPAKSKSETESQMVAEGKQPQRWSRKRDLSTVITNLAEEKRQCHTGPVTDDTTPTKETAPPPFTGYAESVECQDSNGTVRATSTEEDGMELNWESDGNQNLEIDLPSSFSDCDAVSVSYNGQEKTVPLMSMPVVIFGNDGHHRKQRTPVKVIAHDKM